MREAQSKLSLIFVSKMLEKVLKITSALFYLLLDSLYFLYLNHHKLVRRFT
ncbi:MAG: hypothetical protein RLZZ493_1170 [Bacteroidota bacterium]|jgi:hypothetical protein